MLYLISTPIGNLADFSHRAVSVIHACEYLLSEDTRRTRILLNHYDLKTPLKSYHLLNEKKRIQGIIDDLISGKILGLVSDAGTPGIADPGKFLVQACLEHQIEMRAIPGANAALSALILSGFTTERFQFIGFLPKKKKKRKELFSECLDYPGTTICYESPFRIGKALADFSEIDNQKKIFIARELTKKFETHYRGTVKELAAFFDTKPPRGEMVLVF
ncbi:MAG: 16S rRNA (cytidine(1402)-2'-O)-methyltransferase [Chlamydiia bacterium]|nr:16S rRNA (cytidine(1402)-2'-O)-methyltransferase [Chlamydiia bacterium]